MNEKILNTVLVLTPKGIQKIAIAKALNFLFPSGLFNSDGKRIVEFYIKGLKRSWVLESDRSGFKPLSESGVNPDVRIGASLDTIISSQDSRNLQNALNRDDIEVEGDQNNTKEVLIALHNISQSKLDSLIEYGYRFFKLSPKPRINIRTVTLDDIRLAKDVDFIRDEAIRLEKSDLKEALRLMEIAQQARPEGPFIQKKVTEYRLALIQ